MYAATALVTVGFTYIALKGVHLAQVWTALRTSDPAWLVPSLAVFALAVCARAVRWRSLFARGRRPRFLPVLNATLMGYLYNSILPARAGEAVRVVVLTARAPKPAVEVIGTVVLERLYDVTAILLIFFVAEPWLPHVSWFHTAAAAAIVLAVVIVACAAILAVYGDRPLRFALSPLRRLPIFSGERMERTIVELTNGLSGLRDPIVALEAFAWTIVAWLLSALSAWLLTKGFVELHVPLAGGILVTVAIGLGMILPSPPAAFGVFEGAALLGLAAYGFPHSVALPYALILHMANFIPFVLAGVLVVQHNARHPARKAAQAPS